MIRGDMITNPTVIGMAVAITFRVAAALHRAIPQFGHEMNNTMSNHGTLETTPDKPNLLISD